MHRTTLAITLSFLMLSACASNQHFSTQLIPQQQVANTERAVAKTMANRDHAAFSAFLSEEAIFISGSRTLRGKQQIADV